MPQRADGWQANSGWTTDGTLRDSNDATGYQRGGVQENDSAITARVDLGASAAAVKYVEFHGLYQHFYNWSIQHSDDGATWTTPTNLPASAPISYSDCGLHSYTLSVTLTSAIAKRYWRIGVKSVYNGWIGCTDIQHKLCEVFCKNVSSVEIPEVAGPPDPITLEDGGLVVEEPVFGLPGIGVPFPLYPGGLDLEEAVLPPRFALDARSILVYAGFTVEEADLAARPGLAIPPAMLSLAVSPLDLSDHDGNQEGGGVTFGTDGDDPGPILDPARDLYFSQCRNHAGGLWAGPWLVAENVEAAGGVVLEAQNGYVALYSRRGGPDYRQLYIKRHHQSRDWPDDTAEFALTVAGIPGLAQARPLSGARSRSGVLLVNFSNSPQLLRSRDGGQTWERLPGNQGMPSAVLVCEDDVFYAITGASHITSRDFGLTWT